MDNNYTIGVDFGSTTSSDDTRITLYRREYFPESVHYPLDAHDRSWAHWKRMEEIRAIEKLLSIKFRF